MSPVSSRADMCAQTEAVAIRTRRCVAGRLTRIRCGSLGPDRLPEPDMNMRARHLALPLLLLQGACSVSRSVPLSSVAPGSNVVVRFPSAVPVIVGRNERDSTQYQEVSMVRAVEGKFLSSTADTTRLGSVWHIDAPRVPGDGMFQTASFRTSNETSVSVRRFDPEGTAALLVLAGVVAAIALTAEIKLTGLSL